MASQQLCGINVLSFYSSALFESAAGGDNPNETWTKIKWFNFCFGFANFIFTLPAYRYIDTRGRRFLLLVSLGGMSLILPAISAFFYIKTPEVRLGLVASFSIAIFTFLYSLGAGPIPFTLSAEVFPLALREVGMSFSVMVNFLGLGLLILFVPELTLKFGHCDGKALASDTFQPVSGVDTSDCPHGQGNLLFFFTGLNVLAFILSFLFIPGAQKVTLEEMNWIFSKRTSHNIAEHLSHPRWLHDRLTPKKVEGELQLTEPIRYVDRFADAV
ncbi:Sugar and other transporter [Aspergillus sclerotialis]|uniref:Sugar and other transporter n=1 Tax=Aspergillus sclerotialis TaxID=2070753 RepID=A0A3A3A4H2_9EURO|nr:Sugar and other transporter [Aspergillus sclerotialis]